MKQEFEFINKCVFFPKQKILAVGDLHLGYEYMLKDFGVSFPQKQIEQTISELTDILSDLKKRKIKLNKVIFLGDVKHYFAFNKGERNLILKLLDEIGKYVKKEDIIIIKGNHEKMNILNDKDFLDYYIKDDIIFLHGDREFKEISDKKIKLIVMGHLHPAVAISDKQKIRSEKYKCFLVGKNKGKEFIVLPSFFPLIEGTSLNQHIHEDMCIIPINSLEKSSVFAIDPQDKKVYNFGILKNIE